MPCRARRGAHAALDAPADVGGALGVARAARREGHADPVGVALVELAGDADCLVDGQVALSGEAAVVPAPGQVIHGEPWRIGHLHEEDALRRKMESFRAMTGTKKALQITMVTPFGVKTSANSVIANQVTLDDLFQR